MTSSTALRASRTDLWLLGGIGVLLNAAIIYPAVSLLDGGRATAQEPIRRLAVPFENEKAWWEPFRRWVVQEDGRNKPFDTFCREAVRSITGRERFEEVRSMTTGHILSPGHDPVVVVASWLLSHPGETRGSESSACDWEHYPLLWCRNTELRFLLYP